MSAKGAFSATETDSVVIAADGYRASISIQLTGAGPVYLGFNEPAVVGDGICLHDGAPFVEISDARARGTVHMKCAPGVTAVGGYQTL